LCSPSGVSRDPIGRRRNTVAARRHHSPGAGSSPIHDSSALQSSVRHRYMYIDVRATATIAHAVIVLCCTGYRDPRGLKIPARGRGWGTVFPVTLHGDRYGGSTPDGNSPLPSLLPDNFSLFDLKQLETDLTTLYLRPETFVRVVFAMYLYIHSKK
jgi:hypothetical protein